MIWDTVYKYFKMWLWILIGLNVVSKVHGYANGYFPDSCGNMFVNHRGRDGVQYVPQNTELPFTMTLTYSQKGDPIKVTLERNPSAEFRGFMLEAWTNGTEHPVGNFILLESDKTRLLKCRNIPGQAVSQRNNQRKTLIHVNWTAGGQDITDINFRVTFVESFSRFWNVANLNVTLPSPTTPSPNDTTPMTTIKNTTPGTTTETTMPSTTKETTTPSTTTETTTPGTTTETTKPSTTRGTTMPSTTTETTTPSTTTETTTPGTTTETTKPSTTRGTTMPSTTKETTTPSTTTETTTPGTTTETTMPSTTTETTTPGITTEITKPSTTRGPSTTTQRPGLLDLFKGVGTSVMNFRSVLVLLRMELPTILMTMTTLVNSLCSHPNKGLKISCCLLCAAIEISALVLFCLAEPIKVTLLVLVCVTIVINFVELVIVCLPIGPSHELKEISDIIVEACSVIHSIFTIAVIVVSVLDNDSCGKKRKDSWLVKVTIAFTVWMVLFVIWVIIRCILRNTILGRNKTGSLKSSESWRRQRKKKKPSATEKIFSAASALFFFGATCFAVAVTVGIFWCQEK
ncbi:reelin domain-containing protein 1-like isoform X3 [Epinephelus moara]|uniref:reelin domain-containing protein 1-like isoform X3 n=1 Tax=Epinephelus moara TaxID=300413 RepID=UPI00214EB6ED|nr:reelin domain-containing protein 1-like isoform X3 [Epinephelus moara]